MENAPTPPLSERCAICPALEISIRELFMAHRAEAIITESYKHGIQEVIADAIVRSSKNDPDFQGAGTLDREALISEFVTEQGRTLSAFEQRIDTVRDRIAALQLGCAGITRLRGVKNAMEYTVELCGSPAMDETKDGIEEIVRVRRRVVE